MNTHTRYMNAKVKLTKAQRTNLKYVLESYFFQQVTPHKLEHYRCKFVKTLSDSQRSSSEYFARWEAKGLSFPIACNTWGSQTFRLNARQFKPLQDLFQITQHVSLKTSNQRWLELNWSRVHLVEDVLPLIVAAQTKANTLMHKRQQSDKRDHDFVVRMIRKYNIIRFDSAIRWVCARDLRDYHYRFGSKIFNRGELEMLYKCSDRIRVEKATIVMAEQLGNYELS